MPSFPRMDHAFRLMRRRGLLAYQNYQCCDTCAGAALANELEKRLASGAMTEDSFKGVCAFHQQAAEERDARRPFHLGYDALWCVPPGEEKSRELGLPTEEVGKIVCACLDEAGVKYEWNGSGSMKIKVTAWGGTKQEMERDARRREAARLEALRNEVVARAEAAGMKTYVDSYSKRITVSADDMATLLGAFEAEQPKRRKKGKAA